MKVLMNVEKIIFLNENSYRYGTDFLQNSPAHVSTGIRNIGSYDMCNHWVPVPIL
jgi:hypothetical protein